MPENLYVEIVSPDRRAFRGEVERLTAPGTEGTFQVLRHHAPMVAAIETGIIRVTDLQGQEIMFATSGGFVEVLDNTVTVLTETCEPASEIDVDRARSAEQRALERIKEMPAGSAERAKAEEELERARNRLRASMGQV